MKVEEDHRYMKLPKPEPFWEIEFEENHDYDRVNAQALYRRKDGYTVESNGRPVSQIGWTYCPTVYFKGMECKIPKTFWGPGAIRHCMQWLNQNVPMVLSR